VGHLSRSAQGPKFKIALPRSFAPNPQNIHAKFIDLGPAVSELSFIDVDPAVSELSFIDVDPAVSELSFIDVDPAVSEP